MTICKERIRGTKVEKFSRSAIALPEQPIRYTRICSMQAVLRYFGTEWNVRLFWSRETLPGGGAAERRKVCRRGNALWVNRFCNSVIYAGLC